MIKLIKSSFYNEEQTKKELCDFIMWAGQVSFSKYCREFEEKFAAWQQSKYCVFVNSWSSANLIIVQSLLNTGKLKVWDKVGFSALTWATNVMPIIQLWLIPVPIDVELDTLNVSLDTLQKATKETHIDCLCITNLLWWCDNIDEIADYCNKNNIVFFEDNCESMGSVYKWKKLWNYGIMSSFSTYVGHHMSTIEWWMVCTDNKELYDMLVMVRAHGWDRNMSAGDQKSMREKHDVSNWLHANYAFYTLGYNVRPNEVNGFIGCSQMQYIDEIVSIRENNFRKFVNILNNNDDFISLKYDHLDLVSNFAVPVICKSEELLQKYITKFEEAWVEIRPIVWWDMTQQIFWKDLYGENTVETNAKYIHDTGFYFGNSPEYTDDEIELLCSLLK